MRICSIGLNHKTAPVELRERFAVPQSDVETHLQQLVDHHVIREAALLSTCNRFEVTLVTHDPEACMAIAHEHLANMANLPLADVHDFLYSYTTDAAVRHLFAVAAGLDSLVLGEPQILGQVKSAYEHALAAGTAGHILHRFYQCTFSAAKNVRTSTDIGRQSVNVASCAVQLAKQIFGDLHDKRVLLVGAGEMCELAAKHLRKAGVADIMVANRTLARAEKLAQEFQGHALTLDKIDQYIDAADIVLSSTGANSYVLMQETVQQAMQKRQGMPMFLVDIAVPRDIDPRISKLDGVYLYDIDDLQQVVQGNKDNREREAEQARTLLEVDALSFLNWLKSLETVPLIRNIQQQTELLRQEEWEKAARYFKNLDEKQLQAVERFSRALTKRFLHTPLRTLKSLPEDMEGDLLMGATRLLFALDEATDKRGDDERSATRNSQTQR